MIFRNNKKSETKKHRYALFHSLIPMKGLFIYAYKRKKPFLNFFLFLKNSLLKIEKVGNLKEHRKNTITHGWSLKHEKD